MALREWSWDMFLFSVWVVGRLVPRMGAPGRQDAGSTQRDCPCFALQQVDLSQGCQRGPVRLPGGRHGIARQAFLHRRPQEAQTGIAKRPASGI